MAKADGLLPKFLHFQTKIKYTEDQGIEVQLENVTDRDCIYYNTTGCAVGFGWCEEPTVGNGVDDNYYCADGIRRCAP